jgi:hypothetical protein
MPTVNNRGRLFWGSAFGCEPRRGNGSRDSGSHFLFVLVLRQLGPSLRGAELVSVREHRELPRIHLLTRSYPNARH